MTETTHASQNDCEVKVKVAQSYLTFCDPMDYTVHGVLQARILEWVAFPFSRGSLQPMDWIHVFPVPGRFFTGWATREAQEYWSGEPTPSPADFPDLGIELGSPARMAEKTPKVSILYNFYMDYLLL